MYCNNNPLNAIDPTGLEDRLVVTHGTILKNITPNLTSENYYRDSSGNGNSDQFSSDMGNHLNIKSTHYEKWTGENTKQAREDAVKSIVDFVKGNYSKEDDTVYMMGHSHGANIMLEAANQLSESGYKIGSVYTLNPPVRQDYQPNGDYNISHTYSNKDGAQWWGNTDFKPFSADQRINGGHTFNPSSNISQYDITKNAQEYFRTNNAPEGPFKYHQVARDFNFIKDYVKR